MAVRRATRTDGALVRSVLSRFKGSTADEPDGFLDDPRTFLFVAEDHQGIVGWLYAYELLRPEGRRATLLYELEVLEHARGYGHGRALVEALLDEARARGHMRMWVLTDDDNQAAKRLYAAMGANEISRLMYVWELQEPEPPPGEGPSDEPLAR